MKYRRDAENPWQGFDSGAMPYDEKQEKRYQAGIWMILLAAFGCILLYILGHLITERLLVANGNSIVARYDEQTMIATYQDDANHYYSINLTAYDSPVLLEGGDIRLYYRDDIHKAIPELTWQRHVKDLLLFALLAGFCLWRVLSIYFRKSHSYVEDEDSTS